MTAFSDLCSRLWPFDSAALLNRFSPSFEAVIECQQFSRTVLDPTAIAIANWNIAKNNHQEDWLAEARAIAAEYDPDLFFLQEVRIASPEQAPVPFDDHGWHFAPNLRDLLTRHAFGVLTAAKVEHLDHQHLHTQFWILQLSKDLENGIPWSKLDSFAVPVLIADFIRTFKI